MPQSYDWCSIKFSLGTSLSEALRLVVHGTNGPPTTVKPFNNHMIRWAADRLHTKVTSAFMCHQQWACRHAYCN